MTESMSEEFDPYLGWLGIRDPERPPNHYRLLGVELFESDPDILQTAADRQMAHLRTFQQGARSRESQRLLNEVAAAKVCLLDPRSRAKYDQELRTSLQGSRPEIIVTPRPPASARRRDRSDKSAAARASEPGAEATSGVSLRPPGRSPRADRTWRTWLSFCIPLLAVVLLLIGYRVVRDYRAVAKRPVDSVASQANSGTVAEPNPAPSNSDEPPAAADPADPSADTTESAEPAAEALPEAGGADGSAQTAADSSSSSGETSATAGPESTAAANRPGNAEDAASGETQPASADSPPRSWDALPPPSSAGAGRFLAAEPAGAVLVALAQRDLAAAQSTLQALRQNPAAPISPTDLRDLELVYAAIAQFWQAVAEVHQGLTPGMKLDYRSMPVKVTRQGVTFIELEAPDGQKKVFPARRPEIDRDLAVTLAHARFATSPPVAWRLIVAFLLVDRQGDVMLAEQLAQQAELQGMPVEFLPRVLGQLRGVPYAEFEPPIEPMTSLAAGAETNATPNVNTNATATPAGDTPVTPQPSSPTTPETGEDGTGATNLADAQLIPSNDAQREARRRVLTPTLAKLKDSHPPEQWARELLRQSAQQDQDAVARYVLVKAALQRATASREVDVAIAAIDVMADDYGLDRVDLRSKMLQALVRRVKNNGRRPYADLAARWSREAIQAGDFTAAQDFSQLALELGKPVEEPFYRQFLAQLVEESAAIANRSAAIAPLRERLAQNPQDQEAIQQLARFQALWQGDGTRSWQALEQNDDSALSRLAAAELSAPDTADQQFTLGQDWFQYGNQLAEIEQINAYRRAEHWFRKALPGLDRNQSLRVREWLDTIESVLGRSTAELDLTTQTHLTAQVGRGTFGVNRNVDLGRNKLPELNGERITRFLWARAPSRVEYAVPAGAKFFTATALVAGATQDGVRFVVSADGKVIFSSPELKSMGATLPLNIALPAGTKVLELIVHPLNNNTDDDTYWVAPRLTF